MQKAPNYGASSVFGGVGELNHKPNALIINKIINLTLSHQIDNAPLSILALSLEIKDYTEHATRQIKQIRTRVLQPKKISSPYQQSILTFKFSNS